MEGHEEERGSCKIDTSVHERFRATRVVLHGRNDAVSLFHDDEDRSSKLVYTFEDVEMEEERRFDLESLSNKDNYETVKLDHHPIFLLRSRFGVSSKTWHETQPCLLIRRQSVSPGTKKLYILLVQDVTYRRVIFGA